MKAIGVCPGAKVATSTSILASADAPMSGASSAPSTAVCCSASMADSANSPTRGSPVTIESNSVTSLTRTSKTWVPLPVPLSMSQVRYGRAVKLWGSRVVRVIGTVPMSSLPGVAPLLT